MPPRHLLAHKKGTRKNRVKKMQSDSFLIDDNHINVYDLSSRFEEVVDVLSSKPGVILRRHQAGVPQIDFAKLEGSDSYER
jgi:hypothetical protein